MNKRICKLYCVLVCCCFFLTGCIESDTTLTINKDRSADINVKNLVEKSALPSQQFFDESKQSYEVGGSKVVNIEKNNKVGFSAQTHIENINQDSLNGLPKVFSPIKNDFITIEQGIFQDKYSLDILIDYSYDKEAEEYFNSIGNKVLEDAKFNFTLNLPVNAKENNAGSILNGGKTLQWVLISGEKNRVNAKFNLCNWMNIIIAIVLSLLVIGAILFLIFFKKDLHSKIKNILKKTLLILICLIGVSGIFYVAYIGYQSCKLTMNNVDFYPIYKDEKWGYINKKGEIVIKPRFDYADYFKNGMARTYTLNANIGKRDKFYLTDIFQTYKDSDFSNPILMDESEEQRKQELTEDLEKYHYGKQEFINKNGGVIAYSPIYTIDLIPHKDKNNKWGYINKKGEIVIKPQFNDAEVFSQGYAAVCLDNKWGYVNEQGDYLLRPQFDKAYKFNDGLALVCINKKYGFVNLKGDFLYPPSFDDARSFSEELAPVLIGNKWGYIDRRGKWVINPQFEDAYNFSEGLAPVFSGKKYGYINKQGEWLINPQFEEANMFIKGLAITRTNDFNYKYSYIDKSGKIIYSFNLKR